MEKPASEWDPRARLKKGFKTSIDAIIRELKLTLGEISDLDDGSVQAVERIVKKAAKMWLDFGMQRCRVLVVVEGSNLASTEEKIQRAQEDVLKLVVVPELKRLGNPTGQDFTMKEVVGDCHGQVVEVWISRQ